jgi:hypothetical protein
MSCEGQSHIGMEIPLSVAKIVYQVVLNSTADPNHVSSHIDEEDTILWPIWATSSSCSHDCLDDTLPLDEAMLEDMNGPDRPWDDMHHHSYFLPKLVRIKHDHFRSTLSEIVSQFVVPLDTHEIYAKGIWRVFLIPSQPTSLAFLVTLKMYISVWIVRLKKFRSTPISSKNFVLYSLGHMKRCQESTLTLSNMRSKPT